MFQTPTPRDFFRRATLTDWLLHRDPYDFIETYEILNKVFGYRKHYVNLGYWKQGPDTPEAGRALTFRLARLARLTEGQTLMDVGSGLGQAAIDLCQAFDLAHVRGVNINARQVAFANSLAGAFALNHRVWHVVGDAGCNLERWAPSKCDVVLAIECAGHFSDADAFLHSARRTLRKGGRLAMCLNIAKRDLGVVQRGVSLTCFGFVPQPLSTWCERFRRAGFANLEEVDWSEQVLASGLRIALQRLRAGNLGLSPLVARYVALQLAIAYRSVTRGRLGYYALAATA